jgi:dihydroorotate dehydrogenase (NAD+) catalytic subunit
MEVMLVPRAGLVLPGPVIAGSGTFGYGTEYASRRSLQGLGAVVCKGTTRHARAGNEPLRLVETPAGMINSIGLANVGVEEVVRHYAPIWAAWSTPVFVNVSGNSVEEYVEIVQLLDGVPGVTGIELNVSCPNIKEGGVQFGTDPKRAAAVTRAVRDATSLPLMVKLSPNVTSIAEIALAVEAAGADVISLINTVYGMTIDIQRRAPAIANISGGLSGPAIRPLAVYQVYTVAQAVAIPIVGMGGIFSGRDAIEFVMAGASAVAVATLLMVDPGGWRRVTEEIERWCDDHGVRDLGEIVGAANAGFKTRTGETALTGS